VFSALVPSVFTFRTSSFACATSRVTSASSEAAASGEPVLSIASGAVTLGADAVFSASGNLVLEPGAAPAIDANGNALALVADANLDKAGAVVASGATDVDDAGLLGVTGEGVGTDTTPLRTRTTGTAVLTGSGGGGDFRVINEVASDNLDPKAAAAELQKFIGNRS